jgi:antitoxin Phd
LVAIMANPMGFRNHRGELVKLEAVPATRLKNEPASIIDRVAGGKAVAITRHNSTRAVIISYDDFRALAEARAPSLAALSAQFDDMLAGMQTSQSKKALASAFASTPEELGRSAVDEVARKARGSRASAAKRVKKRSGARGGR